MSLVGGRSPCGNKRGNASRIGVEHQLSALLPHEYYATPADIVVANILLNPLIFHRRRRDGGESPGKLPRQAMLERKRAAVLDMNALEARKPAACVELQHFHCQFVEQPAQQQMPEGGKLAFGELIVNRFVAHRACRTVH